MAVGFYEKHSIMRQHLNMGHCYRSLHLLQENCVLRVVATITVFATRVSGTPR